MAHSLKFGIIAGVVSSIPIFFYIRSGSYTQSWLLYLGAMFFFVVISLHILVFRNKRHGDPSTVSGVFGSHTTTTIGVIVSVILCFLMLVLMVPGYLDAGVADKVQTDAPSNVVTDKTGGLSFSAFAGAIIANFAFGSFAGLIWPFYMKRNQTRDSKDPAPLHQRGVE